MNMKKILLSILLVSILLSVAGVGAPEEKLLIVATTTILGEFAQKVGGELVEIYMIVPGGICPAHYDVRPSDIAAISKAALILYHGIEPWLEDLIKAAGAVAPQLQIKGPWGVPPVAIGQIKTIAEALGQVDPVNAQAFLNNAQAFQGEIVGLAQSLKEEAEKLEVSRMNVISQLFQAEFVGWLGFNVVATYPPEERISLAQALELIKLGKEQNAALVIDNLQSGTGFGGKLAFEIGAIHVVLTNFPGVVPGAKDYLKMLEYNANQLFEAKKAYESKKE